jgi:hypothetical protein
MSAGGEKDKSIERLMVSREGQVLNDLCSVNRFKLSTKPKRCAMLLVMGAIIEH